MRNLKYTKRNSQRLLLGFIIVLLFFSLVTVISQAFQQESTQDNELWEIRSIDTMKTSRDKARSELHDKDFDKNIKKEIALIKETGANYITIATPYDEEFRPYLERWIKYSREAGLHIWFRGNWSQWEGWFDYPRGMSAEEHIKKTSQFIKDNPELFADDDIFEGCPECENSKLWKQPQKNKEYNEFLRKQRDSNKAAFASIHKKVKTNIVSIIGGRAKEVVDDETIKAHDNVVSIDHYVKDVEHMREYIEYFKKKKAKVVISEFGAPIPDKNGNMSEDEQADFINSIFQEFYKAKDTVIGVNYYVSILGTTPLLRDDYSKKKAYEVVKNYFTPGRVLGRIEDDQGNLLKDVTIKSKDGIINITSDKNGEYHFAMPPGTVELTFKAKDYITKVDIVTISRSGSEVRKDIKLTTQKQDWIDKLRNYFTIK